MYLPETEMPAILRESLRNDDQLLLHTVGDRTIESFLNAMEATGGQEVWAKRRVRFEHADSLMPDLHPPSKGARSHRGAEPDAPRPERQAVGGPVRAPRNQPMRALLDAGIPLAIGSDGPNNPYLNIMLASTYAGKPNQAVTREQALIAYTATAAYAEFAEKDKGSSAPGKLADLAVLSQDIFRVTNEDLPKTVSVLTMVGGRIAYDAECGQQALTPRKPEALFISTSFRDTPPFGGGCSRPTSGCPSPNSARAGKSLICRLRIRRQSRLDDHPPAPPAPSLALPLRRPPSARLGEPRPAPAARRLQAIRASAQTAPDRSPLVGRPRQSLDRVETGPGDRDPRHRPAVAATSLPPVLDRPLQRPWRPPARQCRASCPRCTNGRGQSLVGCAPNPWRTRRGA